MALPACRYGKDCYRKNPQHFLEFTHPPEIQPPASTNVITDQQGTQETGLASTTQQNVIVDHVATLPDIGAGSTAGSTTGSGQSGEELPPLLPLLRQLSDLSKHGVMEAHTKAQVKGMLLSGDTDQVLSAASILGSLPYSASASASSSSSSSASTSSSSSASAVSSGEGKDGSVMYIMRGIAGSGKSTLAATLVAHGQGVVCSTDDYFLDASGVYRFDPSKLHEAHLWNQQRVKEALRGGLSPVVVDNTHTQRWEAKPYVLLAAKFGYQVQVKEPATSWAKDAKELARRNQHGVPLEAIQRMLDRWEEDFSVQAILAAQPPERRPRDEQSRKGPTKTPKKQTA